MAGDPGQVRQTSLLPWEMNSAPPHPRFPIAAKRLPLWGAALGSAPWESGLWALVGGRFGYLAEGTPGPYGLGLPALKPILKVGCTVTPPLSPTLSPSFPPACSLTCPLRYPHSALLMSPKEMPCAGTAFPTGFRGS